MIALGIIIGYIFIAMSVAYVYNLNDKEYAVGFGCIWPILLVISIVKACSAIYKSIQHQKSEEKIKKLVFQQLLDNSDLSEENKKLIKILNT